MYNNYIKYQKVKEWEQMLLSLLQSDKDFQALPQDRQEIFQILASTLETQSKDLIYLDAEELTETTGIGNRTLWQALTNLPATRQFIKAEMQRFTDVAQRRAFKALQKQAENGNVSAAKEIQELSGIMNQQDNNRVIILHRIERPKEQKQEVK